MRHSLLLIVTIMLAGLATADEASHRAAAEKLLEASRASAMIDAVYDSMGPQFAAMAENMGIEDADRHIFDRHMERVFAVLREELSWEKMEPFMIEAYAEVYSEEELLELSAFYESPLGQKLLDKMPEMMAVTMEMTQSMMGGFSARMEELQAELMADIAASKANDEESHRHE